MAHKNAQDAALPPMQQRFVEEYLVDLNGTQAAIRAGYSKKTAEQYAHQLLKKPSVQAAIAKARSKLSERVEITQEMVLSRYWMIATADPNELIEHRRVCCRHCFGKDHAHQWKNQSEYERAVAAAKRDDLPPPTDEGGYGYDPTIRPHPKCPKCQGEGYGEVHAHDTRDASPGAKALYAGVKQTKDGFEVKMQDQLGALNMVARHLGMFNDKLMLQGDKENPLAVLLREVNGKTLMPGGDQ